MVLSARLCLASPRVHLRASQCPLRLGNRIQNILDQHVSDRVSRHRSLRLKEVIRYERLAIVLESI